MLLGQEGKLLGLISKLRTVVIPSELRVAEGGEGGGGLVSGGVAVARGEGAGWRGGKGRR